MDVLCLASPTKFHVLPNRSSLSEFMETVAANLLRHLLYSPFSAWLREENRVNGDGGVLSPSIENSSSAPQYSLLAQKSVI